MRWQLQWRSAGAGVLLAALTTGCAPRIDPDLLAVVRPLLDEQFWGVRVDGHPIGWTGMRYELVVDREPPVAVLHRRHRSWGAGLGPWVEDVAVTFELTGDGAVVAIAGTRRRGDVVTELRTEPDGEGGLRVVERGAFGERRFDAPRPRETLRTWHRLARWLAVPEGEFVAHETIWPEPPEESLDGELRLSFVRDLGFVDGVALRELIGTWNGAPARWEMRADASHERFVCDGWESWRGPRDVAMAVLPDVCPVYEELGAPAGVTRLELEWRTDGVVPERPWQTVTPVGDGALRISIRGGVDVARDPGPPVELSVSDRERFTGTDRRHDFDHWRVAALLGAMDPPADASLDALRRLIRVVNDAIDFEVTNENRKASDIVILGRGDCMDHTTLFVALARAARIPARPVFGLCYAPGTDPPAFGVHAWAEVHVDGRWISVDPTHEQIHVDATHVTLGLDTWPPTAAPRSLDLRVVSFERSD